MKKLLLSTILAILTVSCIAQDTVSRTASFYHSKYNGRKTTSGEVFSNKNFTAASNDYPLGTKLLIINKVTGQSVEVVVNDRMMQFVIKRIDLSKAAFLKIAPLAQGLQKVNVVQVL